MSQERRQPLGSGAVWRTAVLIPVLLGFALRLRYLLAAEPFVDEPTTLLVAQAIARSGVPTLPSGLFYGNDLPFSYLAGGLVALFGPHLEVIRGLSLLASLATIALVYEAGRRRFSPWAGLWAALLLALSPEAIVWGGRARAYALLALLVFGAVWLFYSGLAAERNGQRRLGWLLLVIAFFIHPEAALLLPAFVLGGALLKGWRWWRRPDRLAELCAAILGAGARYWLQLALARGWIGGFATPTGSRPPLEIGGEWLARLEEVSPFFTETPQLPWTLLAVVALVVAGWATIRKQRKGGHRFALFLSLCLWLTPLGMVLLLGGTYQSPRYLTMLLPIFALATAFGLDWLVGHLGRWRVLVAGLATVALAAGYLPGALDAANTREKGFRSALEVVAEHWQPGDRVATVAPAYSQLVLGRSDFFALGVDYEEFVYRAADGQWVDRWIGSPHIRSAEELAGVLDEGGRLWFVSDESRLRRRFDADLTQLVWQRMALTANTDGVLVFLSHDAPQPATSRSTDAIFGGQVALVGYDLGLNSQRPDETGWGEVVVEPGQALPITLRWQATAPITSEYTVFIHLLGPDGQRYAQDDGLPLAGLQPMSHWLIGETLPDRRSLNLPAELPPGRYRLLVGLYEPGSGDRLPIADLSGRALGEALTLDFVRVLAPGERLPTPNTPLEVDFTGDGDQIRLLGYSLEQLTAREPRLTLYWQAQKPVQADYTVFIHLLDSDEQIRSQGDGPPAGGGYPTSQWDPGEIVVDAHRLSIPAAAPPGRYRLEVGLYVAPSLGGAETGRRLQTADGDRLLLAEVQVQ